PLMHHTLAGVEPGKDARELKLDLALDPGKTVRGNLVDPDGKPLVGVRFRGSWGSEHSGGPLPGATFAPPVVDLERPRPFFFQHDKRKLGIAVLFKGDQTEGLTVKLQPLAAVTGRLLDLDGEPLAGRGLSGCIEDNQLLVKRGWAGF